MAEEMAPFHGGTIVTAIRDAMGPHLGTAEDFEFRITYHSTRYAQGRDTIEPPSGYGCPGPWTLLAVHGAHEGLTAFVWRQPKPNHCHKCGTPMSAGTDCQRCLAAQELVSGR